MLAASRWAVAQVQQLTEQLLRQLWSPPGRFRPPWGRGWAQLWSHMQVQVWRALQVLLCRMKAWRCRSKALSRYQLTYNHLLLPPRRYLRQ